MQNESVDRVVILGRGGAGKSTLARDLGAEAGLSVIELDKEFWNERPNSAGVDAHVRVRRRRG